MSTSKHSLRSFIREVLNEGKAKKQPQVPREEAHYRVAVVATPFRTSNEKRPRKSDEIDPIDLAFIMGRASLNKLMVAADELSAKTDKDNFELGPRESELYDLAMDRCNKIEKRISKSAAVLARNLIWRATKIDPNLLDSVVKDVDGDIPVGTYPIPVLFRDLTELGDPGSRGNAKGKGEAMLILMFGLDDDAPKEPDLTVNNQGYDVKFFEGRSATVEAGATSGKIDPAVQNDVDNLVALVKKFRRIGMQLGLPEAKAGSLTTARLDVILQRILATSPGEAVAAEIKELRTLWDTISLSSHPAFCVYGASIMKAFLVPPEKMKIRAFDFSRASEVIKIGPDIPELQPEQQDTNTAPQVAAAPEPEAAPTELPIDAPAAEQI